MTNFQVFDPTTARRVKDPMMGIPKGGKTISLNLAAYEAIGSPAAVELLYDPGERIVGIRPAAADDLNAYPIRKQPASESYLVACQAFTRHYSIDTSRTRRKKAEMHGEVLAIRLDALSVRPSRTPGSRPDNG